MDKFAKLRQYKVLILLFSTIAASSHNLACIQDYNCRDFRIRCKIEIFLFYEYYS